MSNDTTTAQIPPLCWRCSRPRSLLRRRRTRGRPARGRARGRSLVDEALAANLGLDQVESNVDQRLAILDQARAEYLPQIDLQLRYSEANGGRTIEVPALGLDFRFLREREQDSYVRLVAADLRPAHRGPETRRGTRLGRLALRARGVPPAARARRAPGLLPLARRARVRSACSRRPPGSREENERVNDSLLPQRQGHAGPAPLAPRPSTSRSRSSCLRARAAEDLARRYLNLLCNAPLDREPEAAVVTDARPAAHGRPACRRRAASRSRSAPSTAARELRELDSGIAAAGEAESAARAAFKPQLAFAVDAGTQGEEWDYSVEDSYVLASVILRFNLFNGGGDRAAIREARARSAGLAAGRAARRAADPHRGAAGDHRPRGRRSLARDRRRAASRRPKPPTRSSRRSATSARCRRRNTSTRSAR